MKGTIVDVGGAMQFDFRNGIFARKLSLPRAWTTIRASALIISDIPTSGLTLPNANVGFGFSSGATTGWGDASCTHFVGMATDSGDLTEGGSAFTGMVLRPSKQVTTVKTTGTNLTASGMWSHTYKSYFAVDLIKGSPNFTIKAFVRTTMNATSPPSEATFIGDMEDVTPAYNYHTFTGGKTIAVDEAANGYLDSISFYWGPSHPCQILMWGVTAWT